MKVFRVVLLVLLSVLLPVRGAMAAAMACPDGAATHAPVGGAMHGHPAPHADHASRAECDPHAGHAMHQSTAGAPSAALGHADHHAADGPADGGHAGACQFCASGCCVTPLTMAAPSIVGPPPAHALAFPPIAAPIAAFATDGPERPPRTV